MAGPAASAAVSALAAAASAGGEKTAASVVDTVSRLIVIVAVSLAVVVGFFSRVFSVVKFESVIHEFDPHFNWRVAQTLVKDGFEAFFDWFDPYTWYPLGRIIGGTTYPGIHATSAAIYWVLNALNVPTAVREACVFTPPIFGGLTALASFLFVRELKDTRAGLVAAFFISVNTAYMSRSCAGGYDNEAVAIFAMIFTFYLYVKTLNTGSLFYSVVSNLSFLYMISSWGGYNFVINLVPLHAFVLLLAGRFSWRLYIAYAPFVVFGNLFAMNLPVIGFNALRTSEHMASYFVFAAIHVFAASDIMRRMLPRPLFAAVRRVFLALVALAGAAVAAMVVVYLSASPTFGWSGRSLTLLDPTYASKYIPIIASVAEHAPPVWTQYWQDFNVIVFFVPVGLVLGFFPLTDASLFLVVYGVTSVYFSGIMVRLLLVLAPAACFLGAIGMSELLTALGRSFYAQAAADEGGADAAGEVPGEGEVSAVSVKDMQTKKRGKGDARAERGGPKRKGDRGEEAPEAAPRRQPEQKGPEQGRRRAVFTVPKDASAIVLAGLVFMMFFYLVSSIWMAADFYSNPSIVMQSRAAGGQRVMVDDYREAYTWLRMNSKPDSKIASWWGASCPPRRARVPRPPAPGR